MKLTVSNVSITNNAVTSSLVMSNTIIAESLSLSNVVINSSMVAVGNVSITPTSISTPSLIVGGTPYGQNPIGGILNYQEFNANGVWYNPYSNASVNTYLTGYEQVLVMAWGGGGGGNTSSPGRGGGGGACVISQIPISFFTPTCSVTIGFGGTAGVNGSNTIFAINSTSSIVAYGGGRATSSLNGGGGGWLSAGTENGGGDPLGGTMTSTGTLINSTFGGGGVNGSSVGVTVYGGGGGTSGLVSGSSIFGGSGGSNSGAIGVSVFGGRGGNTTQSATAPGGGGSGAAATAAGARGEVRVWVLGTGSTTIGAPTYTLTSNTTTLDEGSSILYTVTTTNIANGTTLYYTLNNSSTATSSDFSTAVNGSIAILNNVGNFVLDANIDSIDTASESLIMDIRTNSSTGSIVASNNSVSVITQPSSLTYIDYALSGTILAASSTYTFANMPIGDPSPNRTVVVTLAAMTFSSLVNSVTINGVNASQANYVATGFEDIAIFYAAVPNGTTANIVLTLNTAPGSDWNAAIATHRFITTNNTVSATTSSLSTSVTLSVAANDFIVAVGGSDDTTIGAFSSTNFSGARNVAVDFRSSDAFVSISGRATGTSVTLTNAGLEEILIASWKP